MSIYKKLYEEIKKKYGKQASWCIWQLSDNMSKANHDGVGDLSIFNDVDSICKQLTNKYIFVGLNGASHTSDNNSNIWGNFHSTDKKRERDYKLRQALYKTKCWGAYITDFFLYEETDSKKVLEMLETKAGQVFLDKNINRLKDEIQTVNKDAILIAIGNDSYRFLKKYFFETNKIYKIGHYSYYGIKTNDYIDKVREIIKTIK